MAASEDSSTIGLWRSDVNDVDSFSPVSDNRAAVFRSLHPLRVNLNENIVVVDVSNVPI